MDLMQPALRSSSIVSEGVATANLGRWFRNSRAMNADRTPQIFYHSTFSRFSVFQEMCEWLLGFHVGSRASAESRITMKQLECQRDGIRLEEEPTILELYVRAESPVRLKENRTGRWGASDVLQAIMEQAESEGVHGISNSDIDDFYADATEIEGQQWGEPHRELSDNDFVRKWLQSKGYDSVVYHNTFEGGGDCYLLLDASQLKSATMNSGKFDCRNPNIFK